MSFAADFLLYLVFTAVPFKALSYGADPLEMGLLAAASPATYSLLALLFGRWSDRVPRLLLARASCAGVVLACIGLTLAGSILQLIVCIPLVGGSLALFWPSVQASIGDRSSIDELDRNLGRFNLAWSLGKGTGFLLGGWIVSSFGVASAFTLASVMALAIFLLLPQPTRAGPVDALLDGMSGDEEASPPVASWLVDAPAAGAPLVPPEAPELDVRAPRFRSMAWAANASAFGLAATLVYHYPRIVQAQDWSARTFGVFLGFVYLLQTLTFALLMRYPTAWRFRRGRLYAVQMVMAAAVLSLPFVDRMRLFASALAFGVALGLCYYSSIYYSLHTHARRGHNAGVHEALIGFGSMLVPLAGGFVARQFGAAWIPFAVASAAVGISLLLQETFFRSKR